MTGRATYRFQIACKATRSPAFQRSSQAVTDPGSHVPCSRLRPGHFRIPEKYSEQSCYLSRFRSQLPGAEGQRDNAGNGCSWSAPPPGNCHHLSSGLPGADFASTFGPEQADCCSLQPETPARLRSSPNSQVAAGDEIPGRLDDSGTARPDGAQKRLTA